MALVASRSVGFLIKNCHYIPKPDVSWQLFLWMFVLPEPLPVAFAICDGFLLGLTGIGSEGSAIFTIDVHSEKRGVFCGHMQPIGHIGLCKAVSIQACDADGTFGIAGGELTIGGFQRQGILCQADAAMEGFACPVGLRGLHQTADGQGAAAADFFGVGVDKIYLLLEIQPGISAEATPALPPRILTCGPPFPRP